MAAHAYMWVNDGQTGASSRDNVTPVVVVYWQGATSPETLADTAAAAATALGRPTRVCFLHRKLLEEGYTGLEKANVCDIRTAYTLGLETAKWQDRMMRFRARYKAIGGITPRAEIVDFEPFISGQDYGWHISTRGADWTARAALLVKILDDDEIRPLLPPRIQKYRSTDFASGYGTANGDKHKAFTELEFWATKHMNDGVRRTLADTWSRINTGALPIMHNYDDAVRARPFYDYNNNYYPAAPVSVNGWSAPEIYALANLSGLGIYAGKSKNQRYNAGIYSINKMLSLAPKNPAMPWIAGPRFTNIYSNPPTNTIPYLANNGVGHKVVCQAAGALGHGEFIAWTPGISDADITLLSANLGEVVVESRPATHQAEIALDADGFTINGKYSYTYNAADWAWT